MNVARGILGWGNRKVGLEAYGPGGRWFKRAQLDAAGTPGEPGDLLGDHLDREGFNEGDRLVIFGFSRFTSDEEIDEFVARSME